MKPVFTIALKTFGLNVLSLLLLFAEITGLFLITASVIIQLIVAISLLFSNKNRLLGQGMLIGVGIFGLVGFSVCSAILMQSKI